MVWRKLYKETQATWLSWGWLGEDLTDSLRQDVCETSE